MKKIAFFGWEPESNFNAIIPILKKILEKKVSIYYFGFKKYKKAVEQLGIKFYEYPDIEEFFNWVNSDYVSVLKVKEIIKKDIEFNERLLYMFKKIAEYNYNDILQINPDAIFRDYSAINGKIISDRIGKKSVGINCLITLLNDKVKKDPIKLYGLFNSIDFGKVDKIEDSNFYNEIIKGYLEISKKLNIPYINPVGIVDGEDNINICFGGNLIQPEVKYRDKIYLIAKPILNNMYPDNIEDEKLSAFLDDKKQLIYLATGSMIKAKNNFYNLVINSIKRTNYNLIISIPCLRKPYNVRLPDNVIVRSNVDQQKILKNCDLFITAGGYNSICESINNLVPMLVNPLVNDQTYNAYKVESLGIGKIVDGENLSKNEFINYVNDLINNPNYKENLKKIKKNFEKSLDIDQVLDYVISAI